jgi:AcrR family transcriptional regulator
MDAAVAELDHVGADSMTLRSVARRAGVSHAAPAHHFGDKTGMLTAIATEGFRLFVRHLGEAAARFSGEPLEKQLPAMSTAYAEFAEEHPGYFDIMFRPGLTRIEDPDYALASGSAFDALLLFIQGCQGEGWRPHADPRALAAASWALAHGLTVLRAQGSLQRHFPEPSIRAVATLTLALIGPSPSGNATPAKPKRR